MTGIKAKRGKIPPYNLFFIVFVSRLVVTLTYIQSISVGIMAFDLLISVFLAGVLSIVAALPAYLCAVKHKSPLESRALSAFYAMYFVYFAAVNISRFAYFAASRLNPESSMTFYIILFTVAICYAAITGIEGLGRFSVICAIVMLVAVSSAVLFNINNIDLINFYPLIRNSDSDIMKNVALFTANSSEASLFLVLCDKVNGKPARAYFGGFAAAYTMIFILLFCCIGTMGNGATLHSFPVFTLFQLENIGDFSRMDVIHTAFWVLAVFLKCSVLVYASSVVIKKHSHPAKCVFSAAAVGVASVVFTEVAATRMFTLTKYTSFVLCVAFCFVIPLVTLVLKRKRKGDEILEKL